MKITGILSMSNGTGLEYPFPVVILGLSKLCDEVLVGIDPVFPEDEATVQLLGLDNVEVIHAPWDRSNRYIGTEIALQMDRLVNIARGRGSDWVVVMQADEVLHEDDFGMLRSFMERVPRDVTGIALERLYFWRDFSTVRVDWNADLVRIFRPGTYSFLAENTDKGGMFAGQIRPGREIKLPYKIYHYSRVDEDPSKISRRVRNLDTFFHTETSLIEEDVLPEYDFITRAYDNYSKDSPPPVVDGVFMRFDGTPPLGVLEWFRPEGQEDDE